MKILYLANIRIPTEKAHGIQIMKMCEAFANENINLELAVPSFNKKTDNSFGYYGTEKNFEIKRYIAPNLVVFGQIGFLLRTVIFFISFILNSDYKKADIIFVRDINLAFLLALFGIPFVWEIHQDFYNRRAKYAIKKAILIVFITEGLKQKFISYGIKDSDKLQVFPDAVGKERFVITKDKNIPRRLANLPIDVPIVLYSGHLYEWKGVDILAEAASKVRTKCIFVFVGGTDKDVAIFSKKYGYNKIIKILGRRPYAEMANYKQSADILVIPNSGRFDISKTYTSPLKLFSSIASGIPLIASNLPSLREIIDENMAFFFEPDNSTNLAEVIDYVFENEEEAKRRASNARNEAKKHTWDKRAKKIKEIIISKI